MMKQTQMKGHTASHRSPYQRLGIATPTPLGHLWGTTASKPEHVSRFTQQLGGKGGKTWPTDGLGSTLQVYKQQAPNFPVRTTHFRQQPRQPLSGTNETLPQPRWCPKQIQKACPARSEARRNTNSSSTIQCSCSAQ